jgi:hypothetical protein
MQASRRKEFDPGLSQVNATDEQGDFEIRQLSELVGTAIAHHPDRRGLELDEE